MIWARLSLAAALGLGSAQGLPVVEGFDGFLDGDLLTNQLTGLTFANAVILSAGLSLNEFDFPPRSGFNVVSDLGGPIVITFDSPVAAILAYLTYAVGVTITAYL